MGDDMFVDDNSQKDLVVLPVSVNIAGITSVFQAEIPYYYAYINEFLYIAFNEIITLSNKQGKSNTVMLTDDQTDAVRTHIANLIKHDAT